MTGPTLHGALTGLQLRPLLVLLQALVTIGVSYQLLYSRDALLTAEAQHLIILGLFTLVGGLALLPVRIVETRWAIMALVLVNTVLTTAILYWAGNPKSDLYLAYFLIILLASLIPSIKQMIGLSVLLCVGYGAVLYVEAVQTSGALEAHFLRVPVLLILAIFYGVTTDTFRKERHRRMGLIEDITSLKQAQEALRASETKFRDLVENTNDVFWEVDQNGVYTYCSPNVAAILGYDASELLGKTLFDLMPAEEAQRVGPLFGAIVAEQKPFSLLSHMIRRKDGSLATLECSGRPVFDQQGRLIGYRGVDRDITERKQLEDQLRQAQKMEAVGLLAGGIAHDFNNLLTVINGYSQLVLKTVDADSPVRENVTQIQEAGERAAALTRELLAFSRRQPREPRPLNLNEVVAGFVPMLKRLLGEHIQVVEDREPSLGLVLADPTQLEQVIVNLVINARDAMPQGGIVTLITANVEVDGDFARTHPGSKAGPHVMLAVCDTGTGMTADVAARVFEPFFTTKPLGKGTGLGLAMVYGIVKQNEGAIYVQSEPGRGSIFTIYLPRLPGDGRSLEEPKPSPAESSRGTETILLVEDEAGVRNLVSQVLTQQGYRVLTAPNGKAALALVGRYPEAIHLLLTDLVMPEMNGRDLAERLSAVQPTLKVLYVSGYADDVLPHHGVADTGGTLLMKPFTPQVLTQKVREVLDATS